MVFKKIHLLKISRLYTKYRLAIQLAVLLIQFVKLILKITIIFELNVSLSAPVNTNSNIPFISE